MNDRFVNATKMDAKKPPMDLIPWEAMVGASQVLDFGRVKYAAHNWRKGFLWCRLASAALRHIFAWLSGEDLDPESGLSHIDHALCCLMFLSAHIKGDLGKDDRACKLLTEGRADIPEAPKTPTVPVQEGSLLPAAQVPKHKVTRWVWAWLGKDTMGYLRSPEFVSRDLADAYKEKQTDEYKENCETGVYQLLQVQRDNP